MKSVIRPRNYRGGKPHSTYSHKAKMQDEFKAMKLAEYVDTLHVLSDELREEFNSNVRMMERGTGKIKKCIECERIAVISNHYLKGRYWTCFVCNRKKYEKINKENDKKPDWFDGAKRKSDRMQPSYKKLWDEYYRELHRGVTITKL